MNDCGWSKKCSRCAEGLAPVENRTLADVKCGMCLGMAGKRANITSNNNNRRLRLIKDYRSTNECSIARKFQRRYTQNHNTAGFCYISLRNKVRTEAIAHEPNGGDDVLYQFRDGSVLLDRTIVREFQLFKG